MDFLPCLVPVGFFAVVALLVVGLIVWAVWSEKKRTEALCQVANELGLVFYPQGDPALTSVLGDFHLFTQGRSRTVSNLIFGDSGDVRLGIFDYRFTTGSGKNSSTHFQTVFYFQSEKLRLPGFAMRPESFFHAVGKIFGLQDINFETHPEFSRRFILQGSDEAAVRNCFSSGVLSYFEEHPGISVEGGGQRLIVYTARRRLTPPQIRPQLEEAFRTFGLFAG